MMEHKAYLFDYARWERELLPILQVALKSGDCGMLVAFIHQNAGSLTDPYEGEPLDDDWEAMLESKDPHQCGDFALTKYYRPDSDIGLGLDWQAVHDLGPSDRGTSPILGSIVGPNDSPFDPGKMGSYFQDPQEVVENLAFLRQLCERRRFNELDRAIVLLQSAVDLPCGLYVTF